MSSRSWNTLIYIAAIINCVIAVSTFVSQGWNFAGAHAAARNSALFAGLCFALAFAAPGLVRFVPRLPSALTLVGSWFSAQLVHFVTVIILFATFERSHISHHPARAVLVIVFGSALVFAAALTASSRSTVYRIVHNLCIYSVFAIFFLAFAHNRVIGLRFLALVLAVAFILRLFVLFRPAASSLPSTPQTT
jgi:hypothetical protein